MIIFRDQNAGRSHIIKIDNSSLERVEEFKYFGTILTNQNCIQEEFTVFRVCLISFGTESFVSQFAIQKLNIQIYRTIILPRALCGCETLSLILREDRRLWVLENMVLRRIFGPKRDEVTGRWRKLHNQKLNL